MKVISTASTVAQAFKNVGRVREIAGVFAAHGFFDVFQRMRLAKFLPSKKFDEKKDIPTPTRLRLCFEELGPTFVKLGQLLAGRPDFVPEAYIEEFQKLQDRVTTVPFEEIEALLQAELKQSVSEVFSEFDRVPIAAASIAQVHSARLKTGEYVAVKIQRPGIEPIIHNDISILRGIAQLLEKYIEEVRPFNPNGIVEEFFRSILYELDFRVEANNIRKIKSNLSTLERIAIPEVFVKYSTQRVLVLERFEGVRFSEREEMIRQGINPVEVIEAGADAFFYMVMRDGLFHGDLHAGNLFVLKDGRIGIIDFGIVGRLGRKVQDSVITMFLAIMDEDYETLASEYLTLCSSTGATDVVQLQKDLMDTISPYVGLPLGEVNVGQILLKSTTIAVRHNLRVPRELLLLFKAIVTVDGLGKRLDPSFDILQLGNRLAKQVLATRYSKERITRDLILLGRDLQDTVESLPRMLKRFLRTWSANNFAFETRSKDTAHLAASIQQLAHVGALSILSLSLVAVAIAMLFANRGPEWFGLPALFILPLALGMGTLLITLWKGSRK